jgi:hypothetical protein
MHTPDLVAPTTRPAPPVPKPPAAEPARDPPAPATPGRELADVIEARSEAAWPETARAAREAHTAGKATEAERLLRDAVVAAAAAVAVPAGLPKTAPPTAADIRIDLKLSADTEASTRHAEVPGAPDNQWSWIFFGIGAVSHTRAYTEAVITHELVHARQVHTQWLAWQKLAEPREPWMKFMEPYSLRERVEGPQELEAYATGLGFIARLNRAERRQVLRGLFVSFARTAAYTPPAGVTETTTAGSAPAILAAFNAAGGPVQAEFGAELWWSLLKVEGDKEVWRRTLTELAPIARKGYADPKLRPFYDDFLEGVGLTASEVLKP